LTQQRKFLYKTSARVIFFKAQRVLPVTDSFIQLLVAEPVIMTLYIEIHR